MLWLLWLYQEVTPSTCCLQPARKVADVNMLAIVSPAFTLLPPGADFTSLAGWSKPLLLLAGGEDDFCPGDTLQSTVVGTEALTQRTIIPGTDHFWSGALVQVALTITTWASEHIGRSAWQLVTVSKRVARNRRSAAFHRLQARRWWASRFASR